MADSRVDQILKLWPILAVVLAAVSGYTILKVRAADMEKIASKMEDKIDNHETRISRTEEAISQLPEIRADIKDILKEIRRR